MKIIVTHSKFIDALSACYNTKYMSYDAMTALYNWYEELEDDTGTEIELDAVAIGCDWTEYSEKEVIRDYCYLLDIKEEDMTHTDVEDLIDALKYETSVIELDNGNYLVMAF